MPISKTAFEAWGRGSRAANFLGRLLRKYYGTFAHIEGKSRSAAGTIGKRIFNKATRAPVWYGSQLVKNPVMALGVPLGVGGAGYYYVKGMQPYVEHVDPRYDTTQYNNMFSGIDMRKESVDISKLKDAAVLGTALFGGSLMLGKALNVAHDYVVKFNGTFEQKRILENLMATDPVVKNADPEKVNSYYKTICNMAPNISTDINIVRDLLHNFIKFGRIDMQSLKLLVDSEKSYNDATRSVFLGTKF